MSSEGDSGPGRREVAYRLFAAEFDDCSLSYAESDDERAPNYVVTPTGLRVNRLFAVGVLTETEAVNDDTIRGRIVDPTGAFVTYAGQYQPPAQAFLDRTTPPAFVVITGKARTFEPEDSDRVFTSVRPESLSEVEASTRDRWAVSAAESTLRRIAICAAALDSGLRGDQLQEALREAGVDDSLAAGIPRAIDHYGTTTGYLAALRQLAVDVLEVVSDERDEVRSLETAPDEEGDAEIGPLPAVDIDLAVEPAAEPSVAETETDQPTESMEPVDSESAADAVASTDSTESTPETESTVESDTETASTPETEPTAEVGDSAESKTEPSTESPREPDSETVDSDPDPEPVGQAENGATPDADSTVDSEPTDKTDSGGSVDEPGMYQLDDEEREELESEFGSEFSSGNEVDPAGEADIDVPDVDELAEKAEAEADETNTTDTDATTAAEADDSETLGEFEDDLGEFEDTDSPSPDASAEESTTSDEASEADPDMEPSGDETDVTTTDDTDDTATDDTDDTPPAEDVDLEAAVIEVMARLDDGDGVDRAVLVTEVVDTYGVDETAIQEAIADALMGGRCYEPSDDTLKAI